MQGNADVWIGTIEDFNRTGTFDAVYEVMDESFRLHATTGAQVLNRSEARRALEEQRDRLGWTHSEVLRSCEAEGWVTVIFRHTYRDRRATSGAVVRFNDAGRAVALWAHADPVD